MRSKPQVALREDKGYQFASRNLKGQSLGSGWSGFGALPGRRRVTAWIMQADPGPQQFIPAATSAPGRREARRKSRGREQ